MDAVQEFLASDQTANTGGKLKIEKFVVSGGSKRGWTTWLVGIVDPRVMAIVPVVIDAAELRSHHAPPFRGLRVLLAGA